MPHHAASIISPPPAPCHGLPVAVVWCLAFNRAGQATLSFHEDGHNAPDLLRPWMEAHQIREDAVRRQVLAWADNALATLAGQEDDVHYAEAHLAVAGGRLSLAVIPVQTIPDHTPTPPV